MRYIEEIFGFWHAPCVLRSWLIKQSASKVTNIKYTFMSDNTTNNAGQNTPAQKPQPQQAAPAGQKPQGAPQGQGKKNKGIRK